MICGSFYAAANLSRSVYVGRTGERSVWDVTKPTLYSTGSRPPSPAATSHAHFVIRYLYPLSFPHPPPDPKIYTPTSFLWFYILWSTMVLYYIFYIPLILNSPIHTYSVLFTGFVILSLLLLSIGDPTMLSAFFVWIWNTGTWRWFSRIETCSPNITLDV